MNTRYDAVIIGGGVTGCATALFLAREPAFDGSILVVERDPTYEHAPSAKASGGFRQQFSTPENIRIGLFGVHFLKHLDEYLSVDGETPDVGFRENGYLLLSTDSMLPAMRENNALQRELGADVHFRAPDELRARFPWLRTDGVAGGFLSDSNEGYIDPYSLLQAYRRKARSLGVEFVHDEAVSVRQRGREGDRGDARPRRRRRLRRGGQRGRSVRRSGNLRLGGRRDPHRVAQAVHLRLRVPRAHRTDPAHHHRGRGRVPLRGQGVHLQRLSAPRARSGDEGHRRSSTSCSRS